MQDLEREVRDVDARMLRICAEERNEYVREHIQKDFRAGLREMIQRDSTDDDDDDAGTDDRNERIEELARNLQVFCISSTDFMKNMNIVSGTPAVCLNYSLKLSLQF